MILILQIKSIFISLIYGIFYSFTFNMNKSILLHNNIIYKIIVNLLFTIDHGLIYFILLRIINNSTLHIYYVPFFISGIILYKYYFTQQNNSNWLYTYISDILKMKKCVRKE